MLARFLICLAIAPLLSLALAIGYCTSDAKLVDHTFGSQDCQPGVARSSSNYDGLSGRLRGRALTKRNARIENSDGNPAPPPEKASELRHSSLDPRAYMLHYGLCYALVFPDGKHLSRQAGEGMYARSHSIHVPFKICQSTSSFGCSLVEIVPDGGSFYLQDQLSDSPSSNWIQHSHKSWSPTTLRTRRLNALHLSVTSDPVSAGEFQAKKMRYARGSKLSSIDLWAGTKSGAKMDFREVSCGHE
ncbi:hypothetical protein FIBSPDRAFT_952977 [Athelia psychrophila]|uniref:Uncharacterized protein n=1 Tax=Athelia psychrophila TaxID=1759441 RepID=A0A166KXV2_9AGAM|nr:hypothetical protein FIBSPDRAFT_952977 [Fibularhizoctonia sp. CBS 109695]